MSLDGAICERESGRGARLIQVCGHEARIDDVVRRRRGPAIATTGRTRLGVACQRASLAPREEEDALQLILLQL